jgi:hypothetical protein
MKILMRLDLPGFLPSLQSSTGRSISDHGCGCAAACGCGAPHSGEFPCPLHWCVHDALCHLHCMSRSNALMHIIRSGSYSSPAWHWARSRDAFAISQTACLLQVKRAWDAWESPSPLREAAFTASSLTSCARVRILAKNAEKGAAGGLWNTAHRALRILHSSRNVQQDCCC